MRAHSSSAQASCLNSIASSLGALVVLCLPPLEACVRAWSSRLGSEYLKKQEQLAAVHRGYSGAVHGWRMRLNVAWYDYTRPAEEVYVFEQIDQLARGS